MYETSKGASQKGSQWGGGISNSAPHAVLWPARCSCLEVLTVKKLQLIFNSSTNKNRMYKRTFVCSLGNGRQCCAVLLGRRGKCYCPSATQKLRGTHLLWQDGLQLPGATCAHWTKGKFSLIVWFRSIIRISCFYMLCLHIFLFNLIFINIL